MGIQGLIPFLEKSARQVNISQYSGCTVAIDAYCWLHKGVFGCADKLARGDKTDMYVTYCMKYVNMLLSFNIKPILVFDGRHLPAKAETEKKRRQVRETNRRRAAELLRQDKASEARTFLQRCVDVTHEMAVELMKECRSRNIDCITAPYEADAQLAYLNINNIAHIVITEDSDLLLFGCTRVMFKLDMAGNGLLVEQDKLHLSMGLSQGSFSMDKFRYMCILSGCDYLPSLPKIGLGKAFRFIKSTVDPDIHRALSRLGGHLNMNIVVPLEYRDKFVEADVMFRHQPVFDPLSRKLVPLTPLPPGVPLPPLLAKETLNSDQLLQLAYGNLDPFTLKKVDNWSPEIQGTGGRTSNWNVKSVAPHKSIWSADFKPKPLIIEEPDPLRVKRTSTSGKVVEQTVDLPKLSSKRPAPSVEEELSAISSQFSSNPKKKPCVSEGDIIDILEKTDQTPTKIEAEVGEFGSPKKSRSNPFSKETPKENKFSGLSKLAKFRKTTVNHSDVVQSRYFGSVSPQSEHDSQQTCPESKLVCNNTLKDVSNVKGNQVTINNKSPFASPTVEKLSDDGISSLMKELENEPKNGRIGDQNKINSKEKKSNGENNFKWKSSLKANSLADMFGFTTKSPLSSPSVNKKFVNPSRETPNDSSNNLERTPAGKCKTSMRNPFAKVPKSEESQDILTPESFSQTDSSESDILTPERKDKEKVKTSPILTPKPQMKVGLSRKLSSGQTSLLSMFAFQSKPKLQR